MRSVPAVQLSLSFHKSIASPSTAQTQTFSSVSFNSLDVFRLLGANCPDSGEMSCCLESFFFFFLNSLLKDASQHQIHIFFLSRMTVNVNTACVVASDGLVFGKEALLQSLGRSIPSSWHVSPSLFAYFSLLPPLLDVC